MKKQLLCLLSLCIALNTATAKITLPTVLNSNMVLQRECNANLWGTAAPSKKVTVTPSWNNKKYTVTADAQGAWKLAVETPKAGGPYSIRISDGEAIELTNILIGEVWICSGQSNMQMPVKGFTGQPAANAIKTLLQCNNPSIRLFTVKREAQAEPQQDCHSEQGWQEAFPESVGDFSAIGYYFGRTLQQMLGIPIGMIESDWGGTRVESWMTTSAILKTEPDGLNREDRFQGQDQNRASYLYNAMIYPIFNYTARGFLWYQGESNLILGNTPYYARHMQQMVALWREMWGNNEMPFYYVQIAPYIYISTDHTAVPMIVEQQVQALDLIPYSGMAPTLDIGETHCIHPSQKEEVGERLAMLALKKDYGIHGISCEAPRMKE
ncbi:MAG: sialate O-acetylesterase, partial [Alistipes sp.]|nr:sialate O-acetylesterase [Alistipes sp.]